MLEPRRAEIQTALDLRNRPICQSQIQEDVVRCVWSYSVRCLNQGLVKVYFTVPEHPKTHSAALTAAPPAVLPSLASSGSPPPAKFIVFHAQFLVFDTKFLVLNAKSISFTHVERVRLHREQQEGLVPYVRHRVGVPCEFALNSSFKIHNSSFLTIMQIPTGQGLACGLPVGLVLLHELEHIVP